MTTVAVVGAGIAGLVAAHELRGCADVVVIDGSEQVGGKLRTSEVGGVAVDAGAESFLMRAPEAVDLVRAVGLGDDMVHPVTTSAAVLARGRLRPLPRRTLLGVPSSVRSLHGLLSPAEMARAGLDAVLPAAVVEDDVAVGALVARRLGHAVVDRLVDPLLGGVYAGRADELSLRATVPQLSATGRSLMATVRTVMPAGQSSSPVFGTVRGGLGRLATAVADRCGATFLTGRHVRRIERTERGFRVVHGATTDERVVEADAVVLAVPTGPAARLLHDIAPAAAADLAAIDYASVAVVSTAWRRADVPALSVSGYLVPAVLQRPVKAVTLASAKWRHLDAGDVAIIRCSFGRFGESFELRRADDELVGLAVDELRSTLGVTGRPVDERVTRWGGALPQYTVGHLDRVRRIRAALAAVPGLAVCGAAYDGVGVAACIRTGQQAAAQVRSSLGSGAAACSAVQSQRAPEPGVGPAEQT